MDEAQLRTRLQLATAGAIPAADRAPAAVIRKARRRQIRFAAVISTAAAVVVAGAMFFVGSTTNLVGPAPMAGAGNQQVSDPPDHTFASGFSLGTTYIDDRLCAVLNIEVLEFDRHATKTTVCETDPEAPLSVSIESVVFGTDAPDDLVALGGGVAPEVQEVQLVLERNKQRVVDLAVIPGPTDDRFMIAELLERKMLFDRRGRVNGLVRAFDSRGQVVAEQRLCDSETSHCREK